MNTNIYYEVETKYWRRNVPNIHDEFTTTVPKKTDIVESSTKFENKSPFLARENAFNHYFSILDVLYEGLGKEHTTDAQARIDLQHYFDSGNAIEIGGKESKFKSSPDCDKGIEIYAVIEDTLNSTSEKFLIHGIRYLEYLDRFDVGIQESLQGLIQEYNYYKQNEFLVTSYVENLDMESIGGEKVSVLKTPFDWEKLTTDYSGLDLFEVW
ncbi:MULTISPECIES: hypothetical protein [Bizionia]|uniref:Uncharacterized protein n=1 Tax=Bizionia algoritergicola TaxID=291187 RepID=A0A5D0QPI0_9FLAO|nr:MULTISPECIES: hypothetical protein [Bizionia]OBX22593.1 hypothetical protein BAA08_08225 [Bizionia sp. APA-3]TYB70785.1 hypothetical protein ES675_14840 [Bizionia algoritergicola]